MTDGSGGCTVGDMSTNTITDVDAIRDALTAEWHVAATNRVDGFILHPGSDGIVAVTVGSVGRTRPVVRGDQVTSDTAANTRMGFLTDEGRRFALASIASDLTAAGWNVTHLGDVVIVDGRA